MTAEHTQLKRATQLLVRSVGGIEAAASITNRSDSCAGQWVNKNDAKRFINVADLAELEANAASPLVTIALARLHGYKLVPLAGSAEDASELPLMFMTLVKEFGELAERLQAGFADGNFGRTDANRTLPELDDVEAWLAKMRQKLSGIAADAPALSAVA